MTVARVTLDQIEARPLVERKRWGKLVMNLLTTTDHKVIGNMYFVTSLIYFAFAGLLALAIRAELAYPACSSCTTRRSTSSSPCTAR